MYYVSSYGAGHQRTPFICSCSSRFLWHILEPNVAPHQSKSSPTPLLQVGGCYLNVDGSGPRRAFLKTSRLQLRRAAGGACHRGRTTVRSGGGGGSPCCALICELLVPLTSSLSSSSTSSSLSPSSDPWCARAARQGKHAARAHLSGTEGNHETRE